MAQTGQAEDAILTSEDNDEDDEDQSWVLDSLIGFLKSPLWSSSLNNFVDQMSVVFDPDDIEDEEGNVQHRSEYESIFKQYRSLVDQLISSHMVDLGISEEQFAKACEMAEGMLASKLKSVLFEELWAAENFEVFARLMARRNIELQLEALDTLAQRYGLVYDVFVPVGTSAKHFLSEEHVMREAIIRSLDDLELDHSEEENVEIGVDIVAKRRDRQNKGKDDQDNKDVKDDKDDKDDKDGQTAKPNQEAQGDNEDNESSESNELQKDKARLEEVRQRVDKKMYKALQSALTNEVEQEKQVESENTTQSEILDVPKLEVNTPIVEEIIKEENTEAKASREEEIKKRAEHLRQQRDRIIQMKQKERTEKISKYMIKEKEKLKNQPRPKTARRAEPGSESTASKTQPSESDSKELAFRKTLAARLKAEVVFGGK